MIDGEILETLWSVLNESSRSTRGATLAHRGEILDDHMNHSNWKKVVGIGTNHVLHLEVAILLMQIAATLIRKWKRALDFFTDTGDAFKGLSDTADQDMLRMWERKADAAQSNRSQNVKAMDYFTVKEYPGWWHFLIPFPNADILQAPTRSQLQLKLTEKEVAAGRVGLAEFIVDGFKIQETQ